MALATGPMVFLNKSSLSCSNLALESCSLRSKLEVKPSISKVVSVTVDRALLAFSTSLFSFYMALLSLLMSTLYFFCNRDTKCSITL